VDRELVLGGNFAFLGLEHPRPNCYIGCPQPRKHKGRAARSSPTAPRSQRQPPTRDAPPRRVPAPEMAPYANDSDDETTLLVEEAGVVPVYGRAARGKRRKPRACQWAALGAIAALAGFGVVTTRATASTTQNYAQAPFQWRATNDYVETLGSIGDDYAWTLDPAALKVDDVGDALPLRNVEEILLPRTLWATEAAGTRTTGGAWRWNPSDVRAV